MPSFALSERLTAWAKAKTPFQGSLFKMNEARCVNKAFQTQDVQVKIRVLPHFLKDRLHT